VHTKYPKNELTVTWDDNRFEAARIFNQESIKKQGGTTITGKVMFSPTGSARYVGYYEVDELSQGEDIQEFTMPWCRMTTNWSWDEFEILQNRSNPEGFIDLAKAKEMQAMWDLAKLFEEALWQAPTSASDDKYPRGIPYYIRMLDADSTTAGFNGQTIRYRNGSTGTTCSGIDASTYTNWKNWAATYTAVNNDLITTLRTAFLYSEFKPPLGATQFEQRKAAKQRVYTGRPVKAALFDYLDAKDDVHQTKEAFGRMVVSNGGTDMMINGLDVVGIKSLDAATDPVTGDDTDPIYCVDLSYLQPVVYSGYWMNTRGPVHGGTKQHTVWTMFKDGAHNIWCPDPRSAGIVIHKAITS
jgi:hypothetical protein